MPAAASAAAAAVAAAAADVVVVVVVVSSACGMGHISAADHRACQHDSLSLHRDSERMCEGEGGEGTAVDGRGTRACYIRQRTDYPKEAQLSQNREWEKTWVAYLYPYLSSTHWYPPPHSFLPSSPAHSLTHLCVV